MGTLSACGVISILWAAALFGPASPDETAPGETATAAEAGARVVSDWALERVTLADGKSYQGLIQSENASTIDLIEVHRPRGKPMFLVVRTIPRKQIVSWDRLSESEQSQLRERLESHKHRARIEARRMEDLALVAARRDGAMVWTYDGAWFSLESTASEAMTRRSIVRLEQIVAAYRQLLAPRWTAPRRLRVQIFGDSEQYHRALAERGLEIDNPAVYLADKNLILAGSDMNRFDAELAAVNRQHQELRGELDTLVAQTSARVKELNEDLKKNGLPTSERQRIVQAEQKKWEDQRKSARRKLAALDRRNSAKFDEVSGRMFTRLAHEAFHAYLETFVFPRQVYNVPRWLNEGLAQTFESGLLEADTLRVDRPNAAALARLQADLRSDDPLTLAELLTAGSDTFLSSHTQSGGDASRSYLYSWGLAYYLAFERDVLSTPAFDAYLSLATAQKSPVERFEALVGLPLAQFEPQWRETMLKLSAAP
jgi:hypothetical protein